LVLSSEAFVVLPVISIREGEILLVLDFKEELATERVALGCQIHLVGIPREEVVTLRHSADVNPVRSKIVSNDQICHNSIHVSDLQGQVLVDVPTFCLYFIVAEVVLGNPTRSLESIKLLVRSQCNHIILGLDVPFNLTGLLFPWATEHP